MLHNYFKIALRHFSRHKLFTFVNILGLGMGMSVCLIALLCVYDAYVYDSFHPRDYIGQPVEGLSSVALIFKVKGKNTFSPQIGCVSRWLFYLFNVRKAGQRKILIIMGTSCQTSEFSKYIHREFFFQRNSSSP